MTKLCDELNRRRKSLSFCKSTVESKKRKKFIVPGKNEKIRRLKVKVYPMRLEDLCITVFLKVGEYYTP